MELNIILDDENRIKGYRKFPISHEIPVYEIDDIPKDLTKGGYGIVDGKITYLGFTENKLAEKNEQQKSRLRIKRNRIWIGFDIYKSNVQYGLIIETKEEHQKIVEWYNKMLDIEQTEIAIQNIPEKVLKYIPKSNKEMIR